MKYLITQMKLEVLIQYLTTNTINLTPAFQRGRVWKPGDRQSLLKNILQGKPIPAIFLYKEALGSAYAYNILDGKQRIESIMLFIGDQRQDFHIPSWKSYFFTAGDKRQAHFTVALNETTKGVKDLTNLEVLALRDYTLSVIEIDFDDTTTLDEIISLFVDINQRGVQVNRFDIVKALYLKDPLLLQVFKLVAQRQKRREDIYSKPTKSDITFVLQHLDIIKGIQSRPSKIDKMWERLFELALFCRSGQHRKPVEILKEFIRAKKTDTSKLTGAEATRINRVFGFIAEGYRNFALAETRWATDQTHFYILATALFSLAKSGTTLDQTWYKKLISFDSFLAGHATPPKQVKADVKAYTDLSSRQTTDAAKRKSREDILIRFLRTLSSEPAQ